MTKYKFYSTVDRGLEDLVINDLKEIFNIDAYKLKFMGKVFYEGDEDLLYLLNFSARMINRVIILLEHIEGIKSLSDIEKYVKKIDFTNYIEKDQTFAIKANRIGRHNFTSLDIARVSGKAVIENYIDSTNTRLRVDLKKPEVIIYVEVIEDNLLIGIDTSGLSLHIRRYRRYNHPMPLKTTIAYLLVRLIGWDKRKKLLDPTCGSGTIPIEAAHFLRKIPICMFRGKNEYALYKLRFLDINRAEKICDKLIQDVRFEERSEIFGVDINEDHVEGAKINAEYAKVKDTINFITGDAMELAKYFPQKDIEMIVTNPPYQLSDRNYLKKFYQKFIFSMNNVLLDDGKVAMITSEDKLVRSSLEGSKLKILSMRKIPYGSLMVSIFLMGKSL